MSRIRANQFTDKAGTGAPTFPNGVQVTGVATATSFSGALTGNATGLSGTPNITVGSIIASSATISGNVSVAGTLTYEDVTNVDSIGIVTARTGVRIDAGGLVVVGVTTVAAGSTAAPSITPTGDTNTGIFFPSADTIAFGEGGSEAARIDSSGRLLVGTSSSRIGVNLETEGSGGDAANSITRTSNDAGAPILYFAKIRSSSIVQSADTLGFLSFLGYDGSSFREGATITAVVDGTPGANDMPGRLVFATTADGASSPTERMRISQAGLVQIGTQNLPNGTSLQVYASSTSNNDGAAQFGNANTTADACVASFYTATNSTATSNVLIKFGINNYVNGSGQINANGANAAAFGSFSDARLKENIEDLPSQWDNIKSLRPVEFDYIESFGGGHQIGFIAQEMQTVYPDAVGIGEDEMLTVTAWSKTEARLVKALQEALERIETLEAEVAALKAQ